MKQRNLQKDILELQEAEPLTERQDLALRLGISEEELEREIHRLEEEQVILGYGARVNWDQMEDQRVTALIEVNITPQRDLGFDDLARRLYSFREVSDCYLMSGAYDLMVIVHGPSLLSVARFVSEKIAPIDAVLSTRTHFILKKYKMDGQILEPAPSDDRELWSL